MSTCAFIKVHSQPQPLSDQDFLKEERNSILIYLMSLSLIGVVFGFHLFLIYVLEGTLFIFTFIPVLSLLFFIYYKKELVVKNLKGIFYFSFFF